MEGGAGNITVTDAHGSGNSLEPDILLDEMDKHASFEFRDVDFDPYSDVPDPKYQAIVCIGMHARANTSGFLALRRPARPFCSSRRPEICTVMYHE